jgi:hypothetical protein
MAGSSLRKGFSHHLGDDWPEPEDRIAHLAPVYLNPHSLQIAARTFNDDDFFSEKTVFFRPVDNDVACPFGVPSTRIPPFLFRRWQTKVSDARLVIGLLR